MKNTINSSSILNRKLILEVRYEPNPQIVDKRGKILDEIMRANIIPNGQWELGDGMVSIADSLEQNLVTKKCFIDTNRITLMSQCNETNESFFNNFTTLFNIAKDNLTIDIKRIGCRIQGTYSCKSTKYENILNGFIDLFPSQFILEEFPSKDLNFHLVYQNGKYEIGPINVEDIWTKQQFQNEKLRINKPGFAIDTDNYILKTNEIVKSTSIKDVYLTSLSVEKSLFEKLNII